MSGMGLWLPEKGNSSGTPLLASSVPGAIVRPSFGPQVWLRRTRVSTSLLDNLVVFWELEEASGTRTDAHAAFDLTDNNTVTSAAGVVGDAASFNGADLEHLSYGTPASFITSGAYSLQFWTRPGSLADNNGLGHCLTDGAGNAGEWIASMDSMGRFVWRNWRSSGATSGRLTTDDIGLLSAGNWTHVVLVWDGSASAIYTDATSRAYTDANPSSGWTTGFSLGRAYNDTAYHLTGRLDQVGIWHRALSGAEVTALYNSGSGLSYAAMAA